MTDTHAQMSAELLTQIHDQLGADQASELAFHASDDPMLFYAIALSKIKIGDLDLPEHLVGFLYDGITGTQRD